MGNIHSHKLLLCICVVLWAKVSVQFAKPVVMATAGCSILAWACCPVWWALLWGISAGVKDRVIWSSQRGCQKYSPESHCMQPTDLPQSWGVSVLHQGGLNSGSGMSTTAKCKMVWIMAVPFSSCGRASWYRSSTSGCAVPTPEKG